MKSEVSRTYQQGARARATEELKAKILSAFYQQLFSKWFDEITLDDVAKAASTTRQTVIRFYGNKSSLLTAAANLFNERLETRPFVNIQSTMELAARFVARMEEAGDGMYRIACLASRNPEVLPAVRFGRKQHRAEMRTAIAPWLDALPPEHAERTLNECLVVTDTYTWVLLRREYGLETEETVSTIADMLHNILGNRPQKLTAKRKHKL